MRGVSLRGNSESFKAATRAAARLLAANARGPPPPPRLFSLLFVGTFAATFMKEPPFGKDGKKLIKRLAGAFGACKEESKRYGQCVSSHFDRVEKGACEKEFLALQACFTKNIATLRSQGR